MIAESRTPNVAIVGRPNVGKSALFNRLVGRKIAIVHDQPGITRDRISAVTTKASRPLLIWDTGGIGGAGESELAAQVRKTADKAINESDVLLFVVDAKEGLSLIDAELARVLRKSAKPIILVINKIDDPKHENLAADFARLGFKTSVSISAAHGRGMGELSSAIDRLLSTRSDINHRPVRQMADSPSADSSNIKHPAPLAVAVIGRPNAGKSSLINAIVQSERAIVSQLPGTTRDAVDIYFRRGRDEFVLIDTAGIRRRGRQSSSAEVFSVMRAEQTIRRADLCVLIVDLTSGITAQDKRIAGLIQQSRKASMVVLNKWDLIRPRRQLKKVMMDLVEETQRRAFFLDYAPVLIASARTGENVDRLFSRIRKIQSAAKKRIGTGVLNRLLHQAFAANPPPMVAGRRLKLFYATQAGGDTDRQLVPPQFVLFVNDPRLLMETYRRYLETRIRQTEPYPGLPVVLTLRPRSEN